MVFREGFYIFNVDNISKIIYYNKQSSTINFDLNSCDNIDIRDFLRSKKISYSASNNICSISIYNININDFEFIYIGNQKNDLTNIFYDKLVKNFIKYK